MTTDAKERFSSRVRDYVAGRPSYPDAVVRHLEASGALRSGACVVDVGVGTGLSSEPFLRAGYDVVGVEPNANMRAAGDEFLAEYAPRYRSVAGSAEATTLPDASADLVIAAQAFHWFDPLAFRTEALRILRPAGFAALMWNDRDVTTTAFARDYEALLVELGRDYLTIRKRHEGDDAVPAFFGGTAPPVVCFAHARTMTWEDLAALAGSASYLPAPGEPAHAELMQRLRALFDREARDGVVPLAYTTRLYAARA